MAMILYQEHGSQEALELILTKIGLPSVPDFYALIGAIEHLIKRISREELRKGLIGLRSLLREKAEFSTHNFLVWGVWADHDFHKREKYGGVRTITQKSN